MYTAFSMDALSMSHTPGSVGTSGVASTHRVASKLHSWQMMARDVQPSCLLANPEAATHSHHEHTDECWKHLRGPINHTSTHTSTTSSSSVSGSTATGLSNLDPPNTERIMANAAAKLPKETCKKLGESLELYQKLTVSTAVYTYTATGTYLYLTSISLLHMSLIISYKA